MKLTGGKTFFKRLRACLQEFPYKWRTFIQHHSTYYSLLDKKTRRRFERDIKILLSELNIKYECNGDGEKKPSLELRLLIAMGLATLLIGRPGWELPLPGEIVILSRDRIVRNSKSGKTEYAAMATKGTLFLTEKNLAHSFYRYSDGYNNIFHEIAHYFDMEDYKLDGTPSYRRFIKGIEKDLMECKILWKVILETEFEKVSRGELSIRSYAAQNQGEFLACATELFFEDPTRLKNSSADLYRLLKKFYNFDPLELFVRNAGQEKS